MSKGKEKCELLKSIRKYIAERYGFEYLPTECTHQGECSGTCPKCDDELKELQNKLEALGIEELDFLDICVKAIETDEQEYLEGDIKSSTNDDMMITMGIPIPLYDDWWEDEDLPKKANEKE